jgi:serine/threonine-protein kinase
MSDAAITSDDLVALQARVAGRYSVERELGRGAMGIVFLARDVALDRRVAIKLLPGVLAAQVTLRARFLREARLAARLSHPNIVPLHAVEDHEAAVFFVMGYVDGETLAQRIERVGALPPSEVTPILQQVAWALAYAHGHGVVHRDVKPDNILLERGTGRAFVSDFGIARATDEAEQLASAQLTEVGHAVGTAAYMSPEQAAGETVDARSDLYALGVVGFVALTGRPPFSAPTTQAVLAMHLTQPAPPVATVRPGIPARLAGAIDRALRKDPAARFQSGEALADALGTVASLAADVAPPLRNYIRYAEQYTLIIYVLVMFVAVMFVVERRSGPLMVLCAAGGLLGVVLDLGFRSRRLARLGYGWADVRQALVMDRRARQEEIAFLADSESPGRRARQRRGVAAIAAGVVLQAICVVGVRELVVAFPAQKAALRNGAFALAMVGMLATAFGLISIISADPRWDQTGARFLERVWGSGVGRFFMRVSALGVTATEMRGAGGALERLLSDVAGVVPRTGRGVVLAARRRLAELTSEAGRLQERQRELERSIAEAGGAAGPAGAPASTVRDDALARLQEARQATQVEMAAIAATIDSLRMQLLLVRGGVSSVEDLDRTLLGVANGVGGRDRDVGPVPQQPSGLAGSA